LAINAVEGLLATAAPSAGLEENRYITSVKLSTRTAVTALRSLLQIAYIEEGESQTIGITTLHHRNMMS